MSETVATSFPLSEYLILDRLELRGHMNTPDDVVAANIKAAIRRGHPQLHEQMPYSQTDRICLLGGGPSLNDTLPELLEHLQDGAKLITTNGAYKWALDHNLLPSAQIIMDAREINAGFLDPPLPRCQYMLASQCAPATWDAVEGRPHVWIWHSLTGAAEGGLGGILDAFYGGSTRWMGIGGGTTVVMRSLTLLQHLGYTRVDLFGVDSCWLHGKHHAFEQAANVNERAVHIKAAPADAPEQEKHFWCAPWHLAQVSDFVSFLAVHPPPLLVTVHGEGLLAHVIHSCAAVSVIEDEATLAEVDAVVPVP